MTGSVWLADTWAGSPEAADLGADAFVFHVSALSLCSQQRTDWCVSRTALRDLFPVADVDATVAALVAAGMWQPDHDGGYRLTEQPDKWWSA